MAPTCEQAESDPLAPLNDHFERLSDIVNFNADQPVEASHWLQMAGSLVVTEFDFNRTDHSTLMCRGAYEFAEERGARTEPPLTEFTRLVFTWNAYESALEQMLGPEANDKTVRDHLSAHNVPEPNHYSCQIALAKRLIEDTAELRKFRIYVTPSSEYTTNILGLRIAKHLRHAMAHGGHKGFDNAGWDHKSDLKAAVATAACRLLLFTLQMLASTSEEANPEIVLRAGSLEWDWSEYFDSQ